MKTNIHFFIISHWVLLRMRNGSYKRFGENQNSHFMFKTSFRFLKSSRLWDNMKSYVTTGRPQMILWWMCIGCWIPEATDTLNMCYLLRLHPKSSCTITHVCYDTVTLPVLVKHSEKRREALYALVLHSVHQPKEYYRWRTNSYW